MAQEKMNADKMWLTMGPQHPFSHGLWTLRVEVDGEIVTDAEPEVGYLHRGWEKECEQRDYQKEVQEDYPYHFDNHKYHHN